MKEPLEEKCKFGNKECICEENKDCPEDCIKHRTCRDKEFKDEPVKGETFILVYEESHKTIVKLYQKYKEYIRKNLTKDEWVPTEEGIRFVYEICKVIKEYCEPLEDEAKIIPKVLLLKDAGKIFEKVVENTILSLSCLVPKNSIVQKVIEGAKECGVVADNYIINESTRLVEDLGMDSQDIIEYRIYVAETFGIYVYGEECEKYFTTIGKVIELIKKKLEEK